MKERRPRTILILAVSWRRIPEFFSKFGCTPAFPLSFIETIYLMGCGASRQNRVEAISDSATLSNPGQPTFRSARWPERDRAPNIIPVSRRLSLPGSFSPHEVQPNTNYRIWSLFSKQGDGLVRLDPTDNNVDCKGAFSDTTGRFSLCFNFLFCFFFFFFFAFWFLFVIKTILYIPWKFA